MVLRWATWTALAVALATAAAACGGKSSSSASGGDAGAFVTEVNGDVLGGRFGDAFELLHPAQKRIVGSADRLERCLTGEVPDYPDGARYVTKKTRVQPWPVPGTGERASSTAVTVEVRGGSPERLVDRFTQHVFRVGGKWRWILSGPLVKAARTGAC